MPPALDFFEEIGFAAAGVGLAVFAPELVAAAATVDLGEAALAGADATALAVESPAASGLVGALADGSSIAGADSAAATELLPTAVLPDSSAAEAASAWSSLDLDALPAFEETTPVYQNLLGEATERLHQAIADGRLRPGDHLFDYAVEHYLAPATDTAGANVISMATDANAGSARGDSATVVDRVPDYSLRRGILADSPGVDLPFKYFLWSLHESNSAGWSGHHDVSAFDSAHPLEALCRPFRYVALKSLEVEVSPHFPLRERPLELWLCWTPMSRAPVTSGSEAGGIGSIVGSTKVLLLPNTAIGRPVRYPCPLGAINGVLKDSVAYIDTPRLHAYLEQVPGGDEKARLASFYVLGIATFRAPSVY